MATSTRNDCKEAYENVSSRWIVDACHQDSSRIGQCEEQVLVEVYPWEKAGEYGSTVILMCCIYVYTVLTDINFHLYVIFPPFDSWYLLAIPLLHNPLHL